jgi:hypothetical protein
VVVGVGGHAETIHRIQGAATQQSLQE